MISAYTRIIFLLISVIYRADAKCTRSDESPLVYVENSTHLTVAWANSFTQKCYEKPIIITKVEIIWDRTMTLEVERLARYPTIQADPCLSHKIVVKMTYRNRGTTTEECSQKAQYNTNPTIEEVYKCSTTTTTGKAGISSDMLAFVVVAFLPCFSIILAVVIYRSCYNTRKEATDQVDVNPMYDGAADYEYEEMTSHETNKVLTRKREVTAEVVDRSSIYGEEEEGWEDAIVVDNNPYYEC